MKIFGPTLHTISRMQTLSRRTAEQRESSSFSWRNCLFRPCFLCLTLSFGDCPSQIKSSTLLFTLRSTTADTHGQRCIPYGTQAKHNQRQGL